MKSREGTVVDADDLIEDVINEARKGISERGEIVDLDSHEKEEIIRRIGIAALKFFMIKIDPKKRMIFDPQASVDLQGQTGPYIQNAFVRIQSILRKANKNEEQIDNAYQINEDEKSLLVELCSFPYLVENAAHQLDPSSVANFCYNLAKEFHRYYHEHRILKAESEAAHVYRLNFIKLIAEVLENGMNLLGIEMPDRM
jgi:arginyl-tRNA synthetase